LFLRLKPTKMSTNIKCLTPQEEERFLGILKNRKNAERAYMLYHLMLITGLRLSETLSLNVEHANRAKVELKVKGWTKEGEKKDRYKAVYFPKALQKHLKNYIRVKAKKGESFAPEAPLFVSRNTTRISPRQVQRDFKKWVKESGIESNLSPHALRHTVGTRLLKEFKNAKLVQRYLEHSDVATTLRYYVDACPPKL
ncbi:MAG: tyrosine-type recombinase/integrase, partial [Candidatus Omnitrophota bacterium]